MCTNEMLIVQNGVFVLSGRVDELNSVVLALIPDNLTKVVLDRWIVGVDKMALNVLDSEGALACICSVSASNVK